MFNMIYADILGFMNPGFLEGLSNGYAEDIQITQGLLVVSAIVLEIPIAMILLSRVLRDRVNRSANIIAGALTITFVVFGGSRTLTYMFFATIEVACMSLMIWYAWTWPNPVSHSSNTALNPGRLAWLF